MVRPLDGAKIEIMNDGGTTWFNNNQYFDFSHRLFS